MVAPKMRSTELGDKSTFVYVIATQLGDDPIQPCKIGFASNPKKRLAGLQTASPYRLSLYATVGPLSRKEALIVEERFHKARSRYRMAGEWFEIEPDLALFFLVDAAVGNRNACDSTFSMVWCVDVDHGYEPTGRH
jgi:Meiotically up-regulated gene 113